MKKQWWSLLLFGPASLAAQQQVVVSSAGIQQSNQKVQITATLGEPFAAILSGTGQMLTEGFQQAFLDPQQPDALSDREQLTSLSGFSLYPNPATDRLQVQIDHLEGRSFRIQLINALGTLALEAETSESLTQLDIRPLPPGQYWVFLIPSDQSGTLSFSFAKINL